MDNALNVEVISQWLWFIVSLARIAAWPLVIALVAWWNRASILKILNSLAERALTAKAPGGFEVNVGAATSQGREAGTQIAEAPISPTPPALAAIAVRPAITYLEGELRQQLVGIPDPVQQNNLLIGALAETRIRAGHEAIYNRIFGSQLEAMKTLDIRGSATVADAKQYYDTLIPRFPTMYPSYPFDSWLGFMVNTGLVYRDGERLTPTVYGHDFVVYITENRLSGDKPF
jgi:hypothetical protein